MTRNIGTLDRWIRALAGALLLLGWLLSWATGTVAVVLGVVGTVLLLTALAGVCPLYRLFGLTTCPVRA
jgi:hypothetical protein